MGFFDMVKKSAKLATKGATLAKKGLDAVDESMERKFARMSDSQIRTNLDEHPNNKYAREEANKRGL